MAKSELKLLSDKSTKAREALAVAQKKLTEAEPTRSNTHACMHACMHVESEHGVKYMRDACIRDHA
jgi:hypothetical protein